MCFKVSNSLILFFFMILKMKIKLLFILLICTLYTSAQGVDKEKVMRETFLPIITNDDTVKSIHTLRNDIEKVISDNKVNSSDYSIGIYSIKNARYYYNHNLEQLLTPASLTKLFTTFAVINSFGTDYKVKTEIYYTGKIINDTILDGDLYIKGYGDCLIETNDIEYLADRVRKSGIREILGNIYADGSFFDNIYDRFEYSGDDDEVQKTPPISAISLDRNKIKIVASAYGNIGDFIKLQVIPNSEVIRRTINAKVGTSKSSLSLKVLSIPDKDGYQLITASGTLYRKKTKTYIFYILKPEITIAGVFKDRLIHGGVRVFGKVGEKVIHFKDTSNKPILLTDFKRPITELLSEMNKESDNYIAEHLMKMVGGYYRKSGVSLKDYNRRIMAVFDSLNIDCEGCKLNDGSGLSRRNLVKGSAVIKILESLSGRKDFDLIRETFSVAGIDGTLEKRMKETLAEGNLKGKTGTLRNVSGLAGYLKTLDNELLAVVFIFNGNNPGLYKKVENELGEILSMFFFFNEEY